MRNLLETIRRSRLDKLYQKPEIGGQLKDNFFDTCFLLSSMVKNPSKCLSPIGVPGYLVRELNDLLNRDEKKRGEPILIDIKEKGPILTTSFRVLKRTEKSKDDSLLTVTDFADSGIKFIEYIPNVHMNPRLWISTIPVNSSIYEDKDRDYLVNQITGRKMYYYQNNENQKSVNILFGSIVTDFDKLPSVEKFGGDVFDVWGQYVGNFNPLVKVRG